MARVSIFLVMVTLIAGMVGCTQPEPEIPAHFTTYTDELSLFSISYPPEWEPALELIEGLEQAVKDIISSIESDVPLEELSVIFLAGLPTEIGYNPNVNIVVEPLSEPGVTHDEVVAGVIEGNKAVVSDYHEFSRVKTTVDNREATIIEYQGTYPELGTVRYVQMVCLVSKTAWGVACAALPDEYSEWEDDFDAIVRSLRILK
ncbi:MAG: PsbP-related protein [Candidatus Hermodarchaeia archaeon]